MPGAVNAAHGLLVQFELALNARQDQPIYFTQKFILEVRSRVSYVSGMPQTLEKRVTELEKRVAELSAQPIRSNRKKDWRRTIGVFRNDPEFEEAVRLGREYREQQTCAKEIAGS
jgi:hypothetical protein